MNADRVSYDVMTLAAALLPALKAQSRIDRADEEAQATETLARAIGRIERECGIAIAPQEWTWTPRAAGALVPWNAMTEWHLSEVPIRGVAEMTGADADDVTFTDFTLHGNAFQGAFAELHVTRPNGVQIGDVFTIKAGWTDPALMPPELRDVIVRYAASLWEFREAWAAGSAVDTVPEWVTAALGSLWVPRV